MLGVWLNFVGCAQASHVVKGDNIFPLEPVQLASDADENDLRKIRIALAENEDHCLHAVFLAEDIASRENLFEAIMNKEFGYEFSFAQVRGGCGPSESVAYVSLDIKIVDKLKMFSRHWKDWRREGGSDYLVVTGGARAIKCAREESARLAGAMRPSEEKSEEVVMWFEGAACNAADGITVTRLRGVFDGNRSLVFEVQLESLE